MTSAGTGKERRGNRSDLRRDPACSSSKTKRRSARCWCGFARRQYTVTEGVVRGGEARQRGERSTWCCATSGWGRNGAECLRYLLAAQPSLERRFVFVTGDITALADPKGQFEGMPVLAKPFTVTDLDRVLGDVEVGV